jgi:excisionase family DNA binding protein
MSDHVHPNVYTVAEAAALLRVRESWLEHQAAARRIPFTMLAGSYRFTADHLIQIVRMHESKPAATAVPTAPADRHRPHAAGAKGTLSSSVTPLRPRPRAGPRRSAVT